MRGLSFYSYRRTSFAAGALIAVVDVWLVLSTTTPGFHLWADLVSALSASTLYSGTIAAGCAAFEANRWSHAHEHRLRSAPRSPLSDRLRHFTTVAVPLVGGYAAALACTLVIALVTRAYGRPPPLWLSAIAASLVFAAAWGYAIGSLAASHWFVAPAVALTFYAAYIVVRVSDLPFWAASLFPVLTSQDSVFVRHLTPTIAAHVCFFLAGALLLLIVGGRRIGLQRWRLTSTLVVVSVAVATSAATFAAGHGQYTTGHNPRDFVCGADDGVHLCLNVGYASAMKPMLMGLREMNARLAGTPLTAAELEQNVEGIGDDPTGSARSIYLEQLAGPRDIAFSLFRYVSKYGGGPACHVESAADAESAAAVSYVNYWLSGYDEPFYGTPPGYQHVEALRALSLPAANAWFREHFQEYKTCTLELGDLP